MDTIDIRRRNFYLSFPLGATLSLVPQFRKLFPNKFGALIAGSIVSFMALDFPNDFKFNEVTSQINQDNS